MGLLRPLTVLLYTGHSCTIVMQTSRTHVGLGRLAHAHHQATVLEGETVLTSPRGREVSRRIHNISVCNSTNLVSSRRHRLVWHIVGSMRIGDHWVTRLLTWVTASMATRESTRYLAPQVNRCTSGGGWQLCSAQPIDANRKPLRHLRVSTFAAACSRALPRKS
jgi:hypothetical protein